MGTIDSWADNRKRLNGNNNHMLRQRHIVKLNEKTKRRRRTKTQHTTHSTHLTTHNTQPQTPNPSNKREKENATHFTLRCNKINFQTETVYLYSFSFIHSIKPEELLRKSNATILSNYTLKWLQRDIFSIQSLYCCFCCCCCGCYSVHSETVRYRFR